jgi:hypothetical protein
MSRYFEGVKERRQQSNHLRDAYPIGGRISLNRIFKLDDVSGNLIEHIGQNRKEPLVPLSQIGVGIIFRQVFGPATNVCRPDTSCPLIDALWRKATLRAL